MGLLEKFGVFITDQSLALKAIFFDATCAAAMAHPRKVEDLQYAVQYEREARASMEDMLKTANCKLQVCLLAQMILIAMSLAAQHHLHKSTLFGIQDQIDAVAAKYCKFPRAGITVAELSADSYSSPLSPGRQSPSRGRQYVPNFVVLECGGPASAAGILPGDIILQVQKPLCTYVLSSFCMHLLMSVCMGCSCCCMRSPQADGVHIGSISHLETFFGNSSGPSLALTLSRQGKRLQTRLDMLLSSPTDASKTHHGGSYPWSGTAASPWPGNHGAGAAKSP